ncbi:unnamed protein product [Miscanthus lutarioriparius]|uniref:Uncharacterized protein n=1 Tax=Miscanthus lutarioriparius TaxID=422564 RepID=A0A811SPG3_9POAL|nr:unnamed protein product [Miscanthus lutarioriparius]
MASDNKSVVFPALLFLAVALVLTAAASVRAQSSPPPPSQNPCPSGYPNSLAFVQGTAEYLLCGILLVLIPTGPVTPGTSLVNCFCYPTTNITTNVLPPFTPVVVPNINGPLACVQAPI